MRTVHRRSWMRASLVLAAFVTLVPPGAWSLCFGGAGHVALEPTALACADACAEAAEPDACGVDSHDACVDVVLLSGQPVTRPGAIDLSAQPAPVALHGAWDSWTPAVAALPMAFAAAPRAAPSQAPTILRC